MKMMLSHATSLYASGDLSAAKSIVHEIIKLDNECIQAYTLLSQILDDLGLKHDAANALYSATINKRQDVQMLVRAARMSREVGFWQQAITCYEKYMFHMNAADNSAVRLNPEDLDLLFERSVLHAEHGSIRKVPILRR